MINKNFLRIVGSFYLLASKQLIKIQIKKQDYELPKMIIHGPVVGIS